MLLNDTIQIISDGRRALGTLSLAIARNEQEGLNGIPAQKELRNRLLWTYVILNVLNRILKIEDSQVSWILGDYDNTKINRMLLALKEYSGNSGLPILATILNPPSLNTSTGNDGAQGTAGANAYLYIGYATDDTGAGYASTPDPTRKYIAFRQSTTTISTVTAATFTGLWQKYLGDAGEDGDNGNDGQSQYIFQAWSDDNIGTGFTLTFNSTKKWTAFLIKSNPSIPVQADFAGLWSKYVGEDGNDGLDGNTGQSVYGYIAYADASDGTGFSLADPTKDYVAILITTVELSPPTQGDFAGLWKYWKGDAGADGDDGDDGVDGSSAYTYIAYADNASGSGFSTSDFNKDYIAILVTSTEIPSLSETDFTGLWTKYQGTGDRWKTTSATSLTIGTGTMYLVVEEDLAYSTGQRAVIALPNDPSNRMEGTVIFYDPTSGQLQVDVDIDTGSGTYATWDVNLAAAPGVVAGQNAYYAMIATDQGAGGTDQALTAGPDKITQFDTVVSQSTGMTASVATHNITVDNNGAYVIDFHGRVSGPTSVTVLFQIYKNDVAMANMIDVVPFGGSTSQEAVHIHGIIDNVQQEDVFDVRATVSAGTPDLLLEQGRFQMYTVGFLSSEQFKDFENLDVDTGTETVDSFPAATGNAAEFKFVIIKGANFRQQTILCVWDGTNPPEESNVGPVITIGTVDVTVTSDFSGGDIRLRATATSDNWIIRGKRTIIG